MRNCWPDSSFCCCCYCRLHRSSRCFHRTLSFSAACSELVSLARLHRQIREGEVREKTVSDGGFPRHRYICNYSRPLKHSLRRMFDSIMCYDHKLQFARILWNSSLFMKTFYIFKKGQTFKYFYTQKDAAAMYTFDHGGVLYSGWWAIFICATCALKSISQKFSQPEQSSLFHMLLSPLCILWKNVNELFNGHLSTVTLSIFHQSGGSMQLPRSYNDPLGCFWLMPSTPHPVRLDGWLSLSGLST